MVISLITIVTFEVVPAEKILEALFQIPHDEQENEKFVDVGFEGNYMILNLGTMFLIFMITLAMPALLFCSKPCINGRASLRKKHAKCNKSFKGNVFIRFFLESCLDIAICGNLNLIYIWQNDIGLKWGTVFEFVNNVAFIIMCIAIAIMPIWTLVFYCRNFRKWQEEEFEEKYGAVFEGLRKSNRSSLGYPIIFILRRFALVLAIIIFENYLWAQITLMIFISMC